MAIQSKTDICNSALSYVGALLISDIDETGSNNAALCKRFYQPTVDELLRKASWNFAMARSSLAETTSEPPFGYEKSFALPTDCLNVVSVNGNLYDYVIEGRQILTNEEKCELVYVASQDTTANFDTGFRSALEYLLASKMATAIQQDYQLSNNLYEKFRIEFSRAISSDAVENYSQASKTTKQLKTLSGWLNARNINREY